METLEEIDPASLRLVLYPDPVLREVCAEVTEFGEPLKALARRMFSIMYASRGVGLAAPQVGLAMRLFIFDPAAEPGPEAGACANPKIVDASGKAVEEEGCLSFPGITCRAKRFARVTVVGQDLDGDPIRLSGEGLLARIFQHEIDHLSGVLLTEQMSSASRLANRRLLRELEETYESARQA